MARTWASSWAGASSISATASARTTSRAGTSSARATPSERRADGSTTRGTFNRENSRDSLGSRFYASGIEVLRFYGFGNETVEQRRQGLLQGPGKPVPPLSELHLGDRRSTSLTLGTRGPLLAAPRVTTPLSSIPAGRLRSRRLRSGRGSRRPDPRRPRQPAYPRKGGLLAVRGTVWPKVWDVESTYGEVNGNANGYLSAGQWLTLALRGGGKTVFGTIPSSMRPRWGWRPGEGGLDEPGFTVRGFRARRSRATPPSTATPTCACASGT